MENEEYPMDQNTFVSSLEMKSSFKNLIYSCQGSRFLTQINIIKMLCLTHL